jgi:uncharacterized protein YjbI with pentapeptide repeats
LGVTFRTYLAGRRGQLADRYATCVRLLASDRLDERLGGIFALEQLLDESTAERPASVQILVAFLRRRAARPSDELDSRDRDTGPPADIQCVLSVLGRRSAHIEAGSLDLSNLDLRHARLPGVQFAGVRLSHSLLDDADLSAAVLTGADLADCGLTGAKLVGADLRRADLSGADASGANFSNADLRHCVLHETQFHQANLLGASLPGD